MSPRWQLDVALEEQAARVVVVQSAAGRIGDVRFDLSGLPRLDPLLAGRPVTEVPKLVERLCGVCPAAHHLAGVQALEALYGLTGADLPPYAAAVRRLLHAGSVLTMHALRFLTVPAPALDWEAAQALELRQLGLTAMAAAGSPGHFPATAQVGGIAAAADEAALEKCRQQVVAVQGLAVRLVEQALAVTPGSGAASAEAGTFSGADVALTDGNGRADLLGNYLSAVSTEGSHLIGGQRTGGSGQAEGLDWREMDSATPLRFAQNDDQIGDSSGVLQRGLSGMSSLIPEAEAEVDGGEARGVPATQWDQLVAEAYPGQPAPRPYLRQLGIDKGHYRVGPLAQLRVGQLPTPLAAQYQQSWLELAPGSGNALAARAIMTLHCVELVAALVEEIPGLPAELRHELPALPPAGSGVGWVDAARGLLVHRYEASDDGLMVAATILTPTAQNEYWLAELLRQAVTGAVAGDPDLDTPDGSDYRHSARSGAESQNPSVAGVGGRQRISLNLELEDAIREVDPCLPCSAAPPGQMGLVVDYQVVANPEGGN